jgi:hypothetical protein
MLQPILCRAQLTSRLSAKDFTSSKATLWSHCNTVCSHFGLHSWHGIYPKQEHRLPRCHQLINALCNFELDSLPYSPFLYIPPFVPLVPFPLGLFEPPFPLPPGLFLPGALFAISVPSWFIYPASGFVVDEPLVPLVPFQEEELLVFVADGMVDVMSERAGEIV